MHILLFSLILLTILLPFGCGSGSDSEGPDNTNQTPPPAEAGILKGKINGSDWTFVSGKVETKADGKLSLDLYGVDTEMPCYFQADTKDAPFVLFSLKAAVGEYPLSEVGTSAEPVLLNMVYNQGVDRPSMNYLTGKGTIVIDSIGEDFVKGRLVAGDKPTHLISGSFAATVCGDKKTDRSISGSWEESEISAATSLYTRKDSATGESSYVLLAPYMWGDDLQAKVYKVNSGSFSSYDTGGSFSYLKSSKVLLQKPFKGNPSQWTLVTDCPDIVPEPMLSACKLAQQTKKLANRGGPTPTLSLESPYGLSQSNAKLSDLQKMGDIILDNYEAFKLFSSTHKLTSLVLANNSPLHVGFYSEGETFDIYPDDALNEATLKTLLGLSEK